MLFDSSSFFGVPHLATIIFEFFFDVTAYIRCRGLNPLPLGHEPSALTTRPWLLTTLFDPLILHWLFWKMLTLDFNYRFVYGISAVRLASGWCRFRVNRFALSILRVSSFQSEFNQNKSNCKSNIRLIHVKEYKQVYFSSIKKRLSLYLVHGPQAHSPLNNLSQGTFYIHLRPICSLNYSCVTLRSSLRPLL